MSNKANDPQARARPGQGPGFGVGDIGMLGGSWDLVSTYSLHCSSFLGLPFRILSTELVKPTKGTTMVLSKYSYK